MPSWQNVLVYADGRPESSLAVEAALRLAEHVGGVVTALDVLHYLPARVPRGLLESEQNEIMSLVVDLRREQLMDELEGLGAHAPVDVRVTNGNPAHELLRHALRGKHDLIVQTARRRGELADLPGFGSTSLNLVRKSPVPVLMVSPERVPLETPKLLCALGLDDSDEQLAHNRELLAASRQLAAVYGADVHVVHVVSGSDEPTRPSPCGELGSEPFRVVQEQLENLLTAELDGLSRLHVHLLEGDPSDELIGLVKTERFSHLIMGSASRPGTEQPVGSVVEDVLGRVDCTVLTLKRRQREPPREVSPAA